MFRKTIEDSFKPAEGGWTFIAVYPRLVFGPSAYFVTDAEKAQLVERLVRAHWVWLGFLVVAFREAIQRPRRWIAGFASSR